MIGGIAMGKIKQLNYGYEYISDNGIAYDIGENGADFNVIIDTFMDLDEKFDNSPYYSHLVDYVYGDIEEKETLEWIDERIKRYENHERVARFDKYECYVGLKEEKYEKGVRISKEKMEEIQTRTK